MKKNSITQHLSLRCKFKSSNCVELVIMNDRNEIQIEMIPVKLNTELPKEEDTADEVSKSDAEETDLPKDEDKEDK